MEGTYCECCGRLNRDILIELMSATPNDRGVRRAGTHYIYDGKEYIYCDDEISFCRNCGERLNQSGMNFIAEEVDFCDEPDHYEDVLTGYTCHSCGNVEGF